MGSDCSLGSTDTGDGESAGADFSTVIGVGLELAVALLDESRYEGGRTLDRVARAAAQWAREGVPLDDVQHAMHEGVRAGCRLGASPGVMSFHGQAVDGLFLVDLLDTMTSTVARAYVSELRTMLRE